MHKEKRTKRLLNTPVILPLLNVVLIVQVFFMATTYSFRNPELVKVPFQNPHSCAGSWVYDWAVLLDEEGQWWIRENNETAHKKSPEEIRCFLSTHDSRSIQFEIDSETPYFVVESIFAHLKTANGMSSISFVTKIF